MTDDKVRAFRPRGVTIFRSTETGELHALVKSRGRTGAWIRARLMRMTHWQRQPVLEAWWRGECASL